MCINKGTQTWLRCLFLQSRVVLQRAPCVGHQTYRGVRSPLGYFLKSSICISRRDWGTRGRQAEAQTPESTGESERLRKSFIVNFKALSAALEEKQWMGGLPAGEKMCLDREAATRGSMTIYPRAKDDGGDGFDADPPAVTINIIDENDNHPFIQSPDNSYTSFMENMEPNTVDSVIIQLADWDTEEHGCPCTLVLDSSASADSDKFVVEEVVG
ncbi:hypothetical protein E2C01_069440 [Portunus trituberculatus]|uniref:Cadherin domain-containing protein n=1 Tax=Portunus trituberculatus TaxID=210409 RepID=A0A5B7HZD1_PORTR|nr:hypothetical protein [Portunus trituberculatus]